MEHNNYYIEVPGKVEKEDLIRLGINPENIHEVQAQVPTSVIGKIASAIAKVMGVALSTIQSASRKRPACLARLLFVHYAIEANVQREALSTFLGRSGITLQWYEARYQDALQFDKEMRRLDAQVKKFCNKSKPKKSSPMK